MFKKLTALILSLCIISGISVNMNIYAEENVKTASIEFSKFFERKNITKYKFDPGDYVERTVREGRECIRFNYEPRTTYLYIDVDDNLFWYPDGTEVRVTVDYFDEGKGTFTLRYGSVDETYCDNTDIVRLENTCTWKSHEFMLKDITFTNKPEGYDIILAEWSMYMPRSPEEVIFGGVKIEQLPPSPLRTDITSERSGNIFSMDSEKQLNIITVNRTEENINSKLNYKVYNESDVCVYENTLQREMLPGENKYNINIALDKYGTYVLKGVMTYSDNEGKEQTEEFEEWLSVVNIFKDGEPRNANFGMSTHFDRYTNEEKIQTSSQILSEMGIGFARSEHFWSSTELTKGTYSLTNYWTKPTVLKQNGVDTLMILDYGNTLYSSHSSNVDMPTGGEYLDAFVEYCKFIAKTYKGTINCYEIWNEPNNSGFNAFGATAEDYANMLKKVYPALKEIDPNITVVGCATVEVPYDWIKKVFDAGGYDYMDVVSIHPYDWSANFRKDYMRDIVQKIHDLTKDYGEKKEIWYSEVGWSIGTEPTWGVTEEVRPTYGVEMYIMSMAEHLADKIFWYDFQNDGNNTGPSTYNLGTIKNFVGLVTPWAANRIYVAFAALNKMLANAEPEEYTVHDDGLSVYKFKRPDGKYVLAVWSDTDNQTVSMNLGTNAVQKYDIYSNDMGILTSDNGTFLLSAEKKPVYYVGDFKDFKEEKTDISVNISTSTPAIGDDFSFNAQDALGRSLRIETPTELEVVKNEGGTVVLKAPDKTGDYEIEFYVYADDKLCYSGRQTITALERISSSITPRMLSSTRYNAVLTIKNTSSENKISGNARIETEADESYKPNSIRFVDIPPLESQNFEIKMPKMEKSNLRDIKSIITLDDGYVFSSSGKYDFTYGKYCTKPPVIDGKINSGEWKSGWIAADTEYDARAISKWGGKDDISLSSNVMWDDDNLYISAVVKDDIFYQPYTERGTWQGDSVQIGINLPDEKNTDYTVFSNFLIALESSGAKLSRYSSFYKTEIGKLDTADCKIQRKGNYITYEMRIPWNEVFYDGYVPSENEQLGFMIMANDNDGDGRKGWIEYTSGMGSGKDFRQFGTIHLVK